MTTVVHASGRADATQGFTSNRRLLLVAVDKFLGKKLPSATEVMLSDPDGEDFREDERGADALTALRTLRNVSQSLAVVQGRRKAVVYVSEGIDYDIEDPFTTKASALRPRREGGPLGGRGASVVVETKAAMGTANRTSLSIRWTRAG